MYAIYSVLELSLGRLSIHEVRLCPTSTPYDTLEEVHVDLLGGDGGRRRSELK